MTRTRPRPASVTKFVIVSDDPGERDIELVRVLSHVCMCARVRRKTGVPAVVRVGAQGASVSVLVRVPQPRRMILRVF